MTISEAQELIRTAIDQPRTGQVWIDLGSGTGLFSKALSLMLDPTSLVWATDKCEGAFESIRAFAGRAAIRTKHWDFVTHEAPFHHVDGMVMANSLHFVKDKVSLFERLAGMLKDDGRLVIVEYDTCRSNSWIPYPIPYEQLTELAAFLKMKTRRLNSRPSRLNDFIIYSALAQKMS